LDKQEIVAELRRQQADTDALCSELATPEFLAPRGLRWSAADHVRHLTKVMRAITRGMSNPWWKLWIAFGKARRPSRSIEQIRSEYLAGLPNFAGKDNPFAPSPMKPGDPEVQRAQVMAYYDVAINELVAAIDRWDEKSLDRYRLPHPLLGKLTLREMLLFNLYHNLHHIERLRRES
jgi:hypothetical protein